MIKERVSEQSGLADKEEKVLRAVGDVYRYWRELPVQHPDDIGDIINAVHAIQNLLTNRIARRNYPETWVIK